jgi:membrane associated rhomboid family serine protease
MWLHSDVNPFHILMNLFVLWMFGSELALAWGEKRFLRYYLACGVGAGFLIATLPWLVAFAGFDPGASMYVPTVGASGAVMGVLLAYSFTWPDRTIQLLFPPVAFKAIWLIPILFLFELVGARSNVSHVGHLGGVLVGWLYLLQEGRTPGAPTLRTLRHRWRRWSMRRKLRAVRDDEDRWRRGGGGRLH